MNYDIKKEIDVLLQDHIADQNIKDAWQYADEFRSDDHLVLQLGNALGKTEAEIKAVFELANTL